MSNGLNKVQLIGNLAADAELKTTQAGANVCKFRLACNESWVKDGEKQDKTEWVSCVLWGKRGQALAQYLTKGKTIYAEGRLQTSSYEKDGEKRYRTEVNVVEVILLGGGGGQRDGASSHPAAPNTTDEPKKLWNGKPAETFDYPVEDDDLPF